jgi:hypothetical protein
MAEIKRIVCLANSRKHSGRCIAGKEVLADGSYGGWIRPVSARPGAEISEDERRYEDGRTAKLLHIVDVPVIAAAPVLYQSENYIIDSDLYWAKKGKLAVDDLDPLVDNPPCLWWNGDSTYYGANDRVKLDVASKLRTSLLLLKPKDLKLLVPVEGAEFGNPKRRIRASFTYKNVYHSLIVTDPVAETALLAKPNAEYKMNDTYLCVSLGEAHTDGSCYKLAAAVIINGAL